MDFMCNSLESKSLGQDWNHDHTRPLQVGRRAGESEIHCTAV